MELPTSYSPSALFSPNTEDLAFDTVTNKLYGVIYDFQMHIKQGEKAYAINGTLLRTIFGMMSDYWSELQNKVWGYALELVAEHEDVTKEDAQNIEDQNYRIEPEMAVDDDDDDDLYGLAVSEMNGRRSTSSAEPQATATSLSILASGNQAVPSLPVPVDDGAGLAAQPTSTSTLAAALTQSSVSSRPYSDPLDMLAEEGATRFSPSPSNNMDAAPMQQTPTSAPSCLCKRKEDMSLREEDIPEDHLNADGSSRARKKVKPTTKPKPKANAGGGNGGAGGTRRRQGRSGSKPKA